MDPLFVQILDRAVEELNDTRPTGVPETTKRRRIPGSKVTGPSMAVFLGNETVDPPRGSSNQDPLSRRRLLLAVQCVNRTDDVEELDACVAPMIAWAVQVLGRTNLQKLVHYVRETGSQREPEYLDTAIMVATVLFEVSYQTRRTDLSSKGEQ